MSIYVSDGTSDPSFLCSNHGWDDFCAWVHHLDATAYAELVHLREYGWSQNLDELRQQIEQALQREDPRGDVKDTARSLLPQLLNKESAIVITDGLGPLPKVDQ